MRGYSTKKSGDDNCHSCRNVYTTKQLFI